MKNLFFGLFIILATNLVAQQIPADTIPKIEALADLLNEDAKAQFDAATHPTESQLAEYFRKKFSERFFYDHTTVNNRFTHYSTLYKNAADHEKRALDHLGKYSDSTQWILPFNYLNGEAVNAYALRHLARQHKMVDIIHLYFNDGKDPKYIRYFENQMRSLNAALVSDQYEKIEDGNGVYEVFRSGYRILNWLWIHNMILGEPEYSDRDQLLTIATLLQHGQHIYEHNEKFQPGNHQTRGMSALALLSILFRDFKGTELWYDRAMLRLSEHLDKEINSDGFQFERSVHYHMSDINNYFYVYQLAKLNNIPIDGAWEDKLRGLFTTLVKIAYPDKSAPVLQDDTEIPWAEKNDISGAMTLGYLLFENPEFGYFASDKVDDRMYWYLSQSQIKLLENIKRKKPTYGSLAFPNTHYYIMREGWESKDRMLIVSAGLDDEKPDHQHGDMLGIQAMYNGHAILPNYQVRYSLKDFDVFKNSMVKNIALVDDELQGKQWTSNKGGSGFGKFKSLPNPKVISWETNTDFDLFAGSHDGFENVDVTYTRQVISVKDDFWLVKDNFFSDERHEYKQVWQGHYTAEHAPNLLRATFPDASGVDILQLNPVDSVSNSGARGKNWTVVSKQNLESFSFLTLIFPYHGYSNRIDEIAKDKLIGGWLVNQSPWEVIGKNTVSLSKGNNSYFFDVKEIKLVDYSIQLSSKGDLFVKLEGDQLQIRSIGTEKKSITVSETKQSETHTIELNPGGVHELDLKK